jgi:TPR repeat protein
MDSMNTNSKEFEPMLVAKREELINLIHALSPGDSKGQTAIDYLFAIDEEGNGLDKSQLEWRTDWYEKNLANCDPVETVYISKRCYEDGDVDSAIWFLAKGANRGDVEAMYCLALIILGRCEEGKYGVGSTAMSKRITEGLHWLKKAADLGHLPSIETLDLPSIETLKAQQRIIGFANSKRA